MYIFLVSRTLKVNNSEKIQALISCKNNKTLNQSGISLKITWQLTLSIYKFQNIAIGWGPRMIWNRLFAPSGHMARNKLHWDANYQWDFQNKGKSGWTGTISFVLEFPLRNLRPSAIYSVPCDQIVQKGLSFSPDFLPAVVAKLMFQAVIWLR